MSRRKRRGRKSPGNITNEPIYDPFPKQGLVKQYKPLILKQITKYCRQYPDLSRDRLLFRAVEIAIAAERAWKPERGSFATYLIWRLKELHRLNDEDEKANTSPVHYSKGELEQDRAEEQGEEVELDFSGGYNGARLTFDQQWWLPRLVSEVVNYVSRFTDSIPILLVSKRHSSRHRVKAGVQLRGGDNAPAISQRISADLTEVVRQQPISEKLSGWVRAIFDHDIRRQREADDEAQKRAIGDHSPTFLEAEQHNVDVRFPGAKRPPKYLPARVPIASLDAPIRENEAGDEPRTLHDVAGDTGGNPDAPGEGLDERVETTRWDLERARAFLPKNEVPVIDWWLDILDGKRSHSLTDFANEQGISKGEASKRAARVAEKIRAGQK